MVRDRLAGGVGARDVRRGLGRGERRRKLGRIDRRQPGGHLEGEAEVGVAEGSVLRGGGGREHEQGQGGGAHADSLRVAADGSGWRGSPTDGPIVRGVAGLESAAVNTLGTLLLAYAVGCVPFAVLAGRLKASTCASTEAATRGHQRRPPARAGLGPRGAGARHPQGPAADAAPVRAGLGVGSDGPRVRRARRRARSRGAGDLAVPRRQGRGHDDRRAAGAGLARRAAGAARAPRREARDGYVSVASVALAWSFPALVVAGRLLGCRSRCPRAPIRTPPGPRACRCSRRSRLS